MAREKKAQVSIPASREEAETLMAQYTKADNRLATLTAKIDSDIAKLRDKYANEIGELQAAKDTIFERLQAWSMTNPDEFGNARSVAFIHGRVGFRTGTPALNTLADFKWAQVQELVKKLLPGYIRTKEELDKKSILSDISNQQLDVKKLEKCGIAVVQEESFYIEPKTEDIG